MKFIDSIQQILIDKLRSTKKFKKSFKKKLLLSSGSTTTSSPINRSIEFIRTKSSTHNNNNNNKTTMTAQMASFLKLTLVGDGGVGKVRLLTININSY